MINAKSASFLFEFTSFDINFVFRERRAWPADGWTGRWGEFLRVLFKLSLTWWYFKVKPFERENTVSVSFSGLCCWHRKIVNYYIAVAVRTEFPRKNSTIDGLNYFKLSKSLIQSYSSSHFFVDVWMLANDIRCVRDNVKRRSTESNL